MLRTLALMSRDESSRIGLPKQSGQLNQVFKPKKQGFSSSSADQAAEKQTAAIRNVPVVKEKQTAAIRSVPVVKEKQTAAIRPRSVPVVKGVIDLSGGKKQSQSQVEVCKAESSGDNEDDRRINGLGRTLSKILRHEAETLGLKIRADGYCKVNDLLKLDMKTRAGVPLRNHTIADVLEAVEQDNKARFTTVSENDNLFIRANQGHSIKLVTSEKLLKKISSADEVPVCVHGTYKCNLQSILKTGLLPMARNHVHFATGLPKDEGVVSGMRSSTQVLIHLNVEQALKDGMTLYLSDNGVVLTEGLQGVVSPKYFAKVVDKRSGKCLN